MDQFVKVIIDPADENASGLFVAMLSEIGFYAFEEDQRYLIAYILQADLDVDRLKTILPDDRIVSTEMIEDQNWNAKWESDFQPVLVGNFAVVRAAFHEKPVHVKHDLLITPKMSFGTGHHPTTFLMIKMMEHLDFEEKRVIDFGTGTGVLAILSEKLGAADVTAIDYDEWSVENTRENIEANSCRNIAVVKADHLSATRFVDILLANINLNILSNAAADISASVINGGLFLASGFLQQDEAQMTEIFTNRSFEKVEVEQREQWIAILFRKL